MLAAIIVWAVLILAGIALVVWVCWQIIKESDAYSRQRRHEQDREFRRYKGGDHE